MAGRMIDQARLGAFLQRLGDLLDRPGVIFLLGGSSLTWHGVKRETADVDIGLDEAEADPVPLLDAATQAADLIEARLDVMRMTELLPLPEGYAERAEEAIELGNLRVYHFDPYSIALTKLARSAEKDIIDVAAMLRAGLIDCAMLRHHFESVLARYRRHSQRPKIEDFQRKFEAFYGAHCAG